jgi:DNA adenine methylase
MDIYMTPLRYPGGKQRLAPFIRELLIENELLGGDYVEPYAGGAGIAIDLLVNGNVSHVHLNDSSVPIYAFWHSVIFHAEELCKYIADAELSVEEWKRRREVVRAPEKYDLIELGYSTFYLNRCNRSGVLSGGIIGGLAQEGRWKMDARFSKGKLIRRIETIASRSGAITIHNWDAERFMLEYIPTLPLNTFVYCDPPYFAQSSQLYLNDYEEEDHKRIAKVIQEQLQRKWVVSYDGVKEIQELYFLREKFLYRLQYNASKVYKGQEIFIFSDNLKLPSKSSLTFINDAMNPGDNAESPLSQGILLNESRLPPS